MTGEDKTLVDLRTHVTFVPLVRKGSDYLKSTWDLDGWLDL